MGGFRLLLLCGFLAAIAGEAALLDYQSLGYDELFSVYFAEQGAGFLLGEGWHLETNPPLYFLLLDGWIALFGDSAVAVRSLSLLASAATVPVVIRTARTAGLGEGAWLAGAFYLTSAIGARYALIARPYALWVLVLAIALLALVEAMAATTPQQLRRWALGFAAASLVGLYLHDTTVIFLAAADAAFGLVWIAGWKLEWRRLAIWALPQLFVLAGGSPQLLIIWAQRGSPNIAWMPRPNLAWLIQHTVELLAGPGFDFDSLRAPALVLTLILLLIVVPLRASRRLALGGLAVLGLGLLFGAGVLVSRAALWLILPLALLQASALLNVRPGWLRAGLIVFAVTSAGLNAAACLWQYQPEPWRDLLATLESQRRPGDAIVLLNAAPATALRYFGAGDGAPLYRWDATSTDRPGTALRTVDDRVLQPARIGPGGIRTLLGEGRGVWLICRQAAQVPILRMLAAPMRVVELHAEGELLLLHLGMRAP
jgi:mannosyltransferase